jgi:glyoxylase I family protein
VESPGLPLTASFEHASLTVPDLDLATEFFVAVLGAKVVGRATFAADGDGEMEVRWNAHFDAVAELTTLVLAGTTIELWRYQAPDLAEGRPRNCDAGGHHLGWRVPDVRRAADLLRTVPGVQVLGEPAFDRMADGRRRGWVYFLSPWGAHMELAEESGPPD